MKKAILTIGTAILLIAGSSMFSACGNSETKHHEDMNHDENMEMTDEHDEHAHYQCPMKCEGEKTYEEPGICPVCEMDLKEVEVLQEGRKHVISVGRLIPTRIIIK